MLPYFVEHFSNPSSAHRGGQVAADAIRRSREQVASAIGASAGEVLFTSGATESNNLALLGLARGASTGRSRILVSAIEHKCVLAAAESLIGSGFRVEIIPVDSTGLLDLGRLIELLDSSTLLVSVQAANNEVGTVQSISEIAQVVHRVGAAFHCDAAQALGRLPIDVRAWDVDLLSLSAHKVYGPKGVGSLFVRGGTRGSPLSPITFGGGQESGLRPGTMNTPGIVGFGVAAQLAGGSLQQEQARLAALRDRFEIALRESIDGVTFNGALGRRVAGNSSVTIEGADADAIIANVPELAISSGAACSSGAIDPSHVLQAIGLSRQQAFQTIRIGLGRYTMDEDISYAAERLVEVVGLVRRRETSRSLQAAG